MTGWDVLDKIITIFPPIAITFLLIVIVVIFIVGFSRHGFNFLKYGFKQIALDSSLEKCFDKLGQRLDGMDTRIATIETNHFGHLKNYLGILNGVLLDKQIIDNETKTYLDNEVRGM